MNLANWRRRRKKIALEVRQRVTVVVDFLLFWTWEQFGVLLLLFLITFSHTNTHWVSNFAALLACRQFCIIVVICCYFESYNGRNRSNVYSSHIVLSANWNMYLLIVAYDFNLIECSWSGQMCLIILFVAMLHGALFALHSRALSVEPIVLGLCCFFCLISVLHN